MQQVIYHGIRYVWGTHIVRESPEDCTPLRRRSDLASWDGGREEHEWRCTGPGARSLALDLLADATGDGLLALHYCREAEFRLIRILPYQGWSLSRHDVLAWLVRIQEEERIAQEMVSLNEVEEFP